MLGEHLTSQECKGSASSCISAFWADRSTAGQISTTTDNIRFGLIQYFFLHDISMLSQTDTTKRIRVSHIFASINWYRTHPCQSFLPTPLTIIVSPDFDVPGPSMFIPLS